MDSEGGDKPNGGALRFSASLFEATVASVMITSVVVIFSLLDSGSVSSGCSSVRLMLMCCMTTRLTAMALSAKAESSRALLFL